MVAAAVTLLWHHIGKNKVNYGIVYKWREVSISSSSSLSNKPWLERVFVGDELIKAGVSSSHQKPASLLWGFGRRERHICGGGLGWRINSGWKNNLLVAGSYCMEGLNRLGLSTRTFDSSFSSLIAFTLCNCLNLSCNRAIEDWMTIGSLFSLPIWEEDCLFFFLMALLGFSSSYQTV